MSWLIKGSLQLPVTLSIRLMLPLLHTHGTWVQTFRQTLLPQVFYYSCFFLFSFKLCLLNSPTYSFYARNWWDKQTKSQWPSQSAPAFCLDRGNRRPPVKLSAQPPKTTATLTSQTGVSLRMSRFLCHTFADSLAQVH